MNPDDENLSTGPDTLFLSATSEVSGRSAMFEDDGFSGWLYLSAPGEQRPEADCFVYSRVPPVDRIEPGPRGKNAPPLLTIKFANLNAVRPSVPKDAVQLHFSDDGESVAIWLDGEPWAFIAQGEQRGYSKSIAAPGPFGQPWREDRFLGLF